MPNAIISSEPSSALKANHLDPENSEKGYGLVPRTKNGPALAGYGSVAMANALKDTVKTLPARLWRSLTWDRGKELSDHVRFTSESGVKVFFAAPRSPWQRGTITKAT